MKNKRLQVGNWCASCSQEGGPRTALKTREDMKMKYSRQIILILALCIFAPLYANQLAYNGECGLKGHDDNIEICLDKELARYDKELNELYSAFFKRSPHEELKKVELLWVKFKEADCSYVAKEVHGGYYFPFIYKACLVNKTKDRISDLKRSLRYYGWFQDNSV